MVRVAAGSCPEAGSAATAAAMVPAVSAAVSAAVLDMRGSLGPPAAARIARRSGLAAAVSLSRAMALRAARGYCRAEMRILTRAGWDVGPAAVVGVLFLVEVGTESGFAGERPLNAARLQHHHA